MLLLVAAAVQSEAQEGVADMSPLKRPIPTIPDMNFENIGSAIRRRRHADIEARSVKKRGYLHHVQH